MATAPVASSGAQPAKLNLFAVPSQTTLLFAGILVVIGVPLLLSLTAARFLILLPLLPVVVLLFTLWDFLVEPDRICTRFDTAPLPSSADWLSARITALAGEAGIAPPVLLMMHRCMAAPFAFGTWRRHFLVIPGCLIPELERQLDHMDPDQAGYVDVILRHELAHFANHDVWLSYFARSLLKMTVLVLLAYWFALMWSPVIYFMALPMVGQFTTQYASMVALLPPDLQQLLASPPEMTWTRAATQWMELSMTLLPFVLGAIVLWVHDWNLLLRIREVYADARVATWLHSSIPLQTTLDWFLARVPLITAQCAPSTARPSPWPFWRTANASNPSGQPLSWSLDLPLRRSLRPGPQPTKGVRRQVLVQPATAYGEARQIGLRTGVIVLLFYLIMASLLGPVHEGIAAEIPIGFGFVALALALTPAAFTNLGEPRKIRSDFLRATSFFLLVFDGVMALALLVATAGVLARPQDLNLVMYAIAGVLPVTVETVIPDPVGYMIQAMVGAFFIFFVGAPLLLVGGLYLDLAFKRRLLSWYGAPWLARRARLAFWGITLLLGLILWLGVAPLLTLAAFPLIMTLEPKLWISVVGAALIAIVAGVLFRRADRRYRARCPHCNAQVTTPFHLGATCPQCNETLQPWLIAPY